MKNGDLVVYEKNIKNPFEGFELRSHVLCC